MGQFLKKIWQLTKPYWVSEEKWRALALLLVLLVCGALLVRLQVLSNQVNKNFYDAIQAYDKTHLLNYAARYIIIIIIFAAVAAMQGYVGSILVNRWRRWLTHYYLNNWLSDKSYYRMIINQQTVDNPDQRIADDLNEFTSLTLSLFGGFYNSIIQLITFTALLWTLSGIYPLNIGHKIINIHGYMLWCAIIYSVVNTWITTVIGRKLAKLNYDQQHFNADFRFGLMRLREYSEQVALYDGEQTESKSLKRTYQPVFDNFVKIISVSRNLTFFTQATSYLSLLIGTLFALPKFLREHISLGSVTQLSSAFGYVVDGLFFFINAYGTIANWRAVVHRLTEFSDKIALSKTIHADNLLLIPNECELQMNTLQLFKPDGSLLLQPINETIFPKEKVLFMGEYGSGKSTLFKTIAGLWPYAKGEIQKPYSNFMFLPQKPYIPLGTLKEAICFPESAEKYSDQIINQVIQECRLGTYKDKLHTIQNWNNEFSLGEQQMLAFARVLLKKPHWLFLDEATSSLDEANEKSIYQLLFEKMPETTFVSIGHRHSLIDLHERVIQLT